MLVQVWFVSVLAQSSATSCSPLQKKLPKKDNFTKPKGLIVTKQKIKKKHIHQHFDQTIQIKFTGSPFSIIYHILVEKERFLFA